MLKFSVSSRKAFFHGWRRGILRGAAVGGLAGALAGTVLLPLAGTVAGAIGGMAGGGVAALSLAPIVTKLALSRPDIAGRVGMANWCGAVGGFVLAPIITLALLFPNHYLRGGVSAVAMALPFLLPVAAGGAWAAVGIVKDLGDEQTRKDISTGEYGFVVRLRLVVLYAVLSAPCAWAVSSVTSRDVIG